jgi:hypothetical protein
MSANETMAVFGPTEMLAGTARFATRALASSLGDLPVLEFEDGTATAGEYAIFGGFLPQTYAAGSLRVRIAWMAESATTNAVKWDAAFKSFTDNVDDMDVKVFAASQTATTTTADTSSGKLKYTEITLTQAQADSVAAGEYFQLYLFRDADNGADTMSGDAQVVGVLVYEV